MMSDRAPTRVFISDSQPIYAHGIAAALRGAGDLWVSVTETAPGELLGHDAADVLVVGVEGDVHGVWAACDHLLALLLTPPAPRVVLLLPGRSEFEMTAAASLGAAAVLPRTSSPPALLDAVRAVADGRTLVAAGMAERMLSEFAGMLRRSREAAEIDLSKREREVLALVAEGRSNRDIAGRLHISENTVKNHVRRIMEKTGTSSRTGAVAEAAKQGLLVVGHSTTIPSARRA
jgi:DNA-binding NarL/FixJ family response regulator